MSNETEVHTYPGDYPPLVVEFENDEGAEFRVGFTHEQAESLMFDLGDALNELVEEEA